VRNGLPQTLSFREQRKCLKHLAQFTYCYCGHAHNKSDLIVRVTFESHVFSTSNGQGPHDFLDENGNNRWFCEDRYAVSLGLRAEVAQILDLNVYTWEERDRNQAANLAVLTPAAQPLSNSTHRVVIYYLYGSTVPGIHVEMKLKTCYSKEIDFTKRSKREKIRTYIKSICYKGGRIPKS
jgi:hypothetical protein